MHLLNDLKHYDEVEDAYSFGEYHHVVMKENYNEEDTAEIILNKKAIKNLIIEKYCNQLLKIVLCN